MEYKGIKYSHIRQGKWVIDYLKDEFFNCEQDLKNYIDTKIFNIDLINK